MVEGGREHALTKVGWEEGSQSYQIRGIRVLWVRKCNMTIYLYKILILGMGRKKKGNEIKWVNIFT